MPVAGTWLQRDRKPREGDHLGESVEPVAAGRVANGPILDLTRPRDQVEHTEVKPAVLEDRHPPAKPNLQPGGHLGKPSVPTSLRRVHDERGRKLTVGTASFRATKVAREPDADRDDGGLQVRLRARAGEALETHGSPVEV